MLLPPPPSLITACAHVKKAAAHPLLLLLLSLATGGERRKEEASTLFPSSSSSSAASPSPSLPPGSSLGSLLPIPTYRQLSRGASSSSKTSTTPPPPCKGGCQRNMPSPPLPLLIPKDAHRSSSSCLGFGTDSGGGSGCPSEAATVRGGDFFLLLPRQRGGISGQKIADVVA